MNEVPDAVRETIENEAQGGVVEDIERKWRNGRTIYEVEIERNDQELELHIDENGKVIRRERND